MTIHFPEYLSGEVEEILCERARRAMSPGSWSRDHLKRIATAVGGDTRAAIQILRRAAAAAEEKGSEELDMGLIDLQLQQHRAIQRTSRIANLSEHEKIIHELATRHGPLGTTELRRQYRNYCLAHDMQPIAPRTFTKYLRRLGSAGILKISARPMATGGRRVEVVHD
jgi:Cdc6-like AAA superfamily ATPase